MSLERLSDNNSLSPVIKNESEIRHSKTINVESFEDECTPANKKKEVRKKLSRISEFEVNSSAIFP